MGFDTNGVKLLIHAKNLDVNFDKVITIGRQGLHLKEKELQNLIRKAGLSTDAGKDIFKNNNYAEPFLKLLGATIADSLDASDYEGATLIHNLNLPISNDLKSKYTLVIDGGSLEHVFNFPVAIKNCMDLIQKNGYYIGITPANNFFGHGFYQFSPELYYRIFSPSNGFRMVKMYFYINCKGGAFYEVSDPLDVHQRVAMVNSYPSYLFIIAQKEDEKEVFMQMPQQSDYEHISWKEKTDTLTIPKVSIFSSMMRSLPKSVRSTILALYQSAQSFRRYRPTGISNPRFIKKVRITIANKR